MERRIVSLFLIGILLLNVVGCSINKPVARAGADKQLDLAIKYLADEKYHQAVLAYNDVIKINPREITAYKGLSLAYTLQKKDKEAKSALEQGLKVIPDNNDLTLALASLLIDLKQPSEAELLYKNLINDSPSYYVIKEYDQYLIDQHRSDEAISLILASLEKKPKDYRLQCLAARTYLLQGQKDKAVSYAVNSLGCESEQAEGYNILQQIYMNRCDDLLNLGDSYLKQGQVDKGMVLKFFALIRSEKYRDALVFYKNMPTEEQNLIRNRIWLSQIYKQLNDNNKALEVLRDIKMAKLKDAGLAAEIARLYMDLGQRSDARNAALLGIRLDSNLIDNYRLLTSLSTGIDVRIWELKWQVASLNNSKHDANEFMQPAIQTNVAPSSSADNKGQSQANADLVPTTDAKHTEQLNKYERFAKNQCWSNIRKFEGAKSFWKAAYESSPDSAGDLRDYLKSWPICPDGGSYSNVTTSAHDLATPATCSIHGHPQ